MLEKENIPITAKRILDMMIENSARPYTYDDLKSLREFTGESKIREALSYLKNRKILHRTKPVGSPLKGKTNDKAKKMNYDSRHYFKTQYPAACCGWDKEHVTPT